MRSPRVARALTPSKWNCSPAFRLYLSGVIRNLAADSLPRALRLLHLVSRREQRDVTIPGPATGCHAQRWTGGIAFCYIVWHTWHLRFSGVHILSHPARHSAKCNWNSSTPGPSRFTLGNLLRLLALRLRTVAVRRQVGNHHGRRGPAQVRICLLRHRIAVHPVGALTMCSFLTTPLQPSVRRTACMTPTPARRGR